MKWTNIAGLIGGVGIVANVIAIVEFGSHHVWSYFLLGLFVAGTAVTPARSRLLAYGQIRSLLNDAEETLKREGLQPERLIAFDRSSAIYAGMLAQRLGIGEIISLPRSAHPAPRPPAPREISVGEGVRMNLGDDRLQKSVIIVFHLRTGATLEAGLHFLTPKGGIYPGRILVMYATDGGLAHWPGILYVRRVKAGEIPQDSFPWMSGPYVHT